MGNSIVVIDYKRAFLYTKFNLAIKRAFQEASKKCLYRLAPGYLTSCADYLSQLWRCVRNLLDFRDKICEYMLAMFCVTMHSQSVSHFSRLWNRYVKYQRLDCLHEYGFQVHDIWQAHLVEILLLSSLSSFLAFLSFLLRDIIITKQCIISPFLWVWKKLLHNKGNLLKQGICIWQLSSIVSTVYTAKLITLEVVIFLVFLPVSSLNLSPVWWWKESSCWMLLLSWQLWI
jgi:hypothetical protein